MARKFRFTEKTRSRRAVLAILLAALGLGGFAALIYLAVVRRGSLSAYIGALGLFLLLISVLAFFVAVGAVREENSFQTMPRIALILSASASVLWILLYAWGFTL